jgi:hypothetical protein
MENGNPLAQRLDPARLPRGLRAWNVDFANGQFTTLWRIRNLTGKPLEIHWFAGGIHGVKLQGRSEQMNVQVDQEITLSLQRWLGWPESCCKSIRGGPRAARYGVHFIH